jgi:hypothetical protein
MSRTVRSRSVHDWTEQPARPRCFKSLTVERLNKRQEGDKYASVVPAWFRRMTNKLNRHRANNALRASLQKDWDDVFLPVFPNSVRWDWF